MSSWGLEVELFRNCMQLEVTHVQFVQNSQMTHLPLSKTVHIGFSANDEVIGFQTLATLCLQHVHPEYDKLKQEQKISNVRQFLSLYKSEIFLNRPENSNYLPVPVPHEDTFLENFYISGDHFSNRNGYGPDQQKQMLIPELIIHPIGRYRSHVRQEQSLEFIKFLFLMASHLSRLNPRRDASYLLKTDVKLKHYGLSQLCEDDVFLFGKLTIAKPLVNQPVNANSFSPQITTVIDLTHFTHHINNGNPTLHEGWIYTTITSKSDFLIRFLFELIPNRTAKYECGLIFLTRKILALTVNERHAENAKIGSISYPDGPHYPWIEGAIGFGLVYMLTLLIGIRNPQRSVNKNLFHLFPKTGSSTILKEATRAALDYYPSLVDHLGTVLFNIFQNPQTHPLTKQKELYYIPDLGMMNDTLTNFDYILNRLHIDMLIIEPSLIEKFKRDFKSFWDKGLFIPRIMHAYFLSFLPKQRSYAQLIKRHRNTLWKIDGLADLAFGKTIHDYIKFAEEIFTQEDRIYSSSQPGFGRPKFELRGLQCFTMHNVASAAWMNQVTEICDGLGQSALPLPRTLKNPSQTPSIDQTSTIGASDYQSYLDEFPDSPNARNPVWFPGQPTHEFGVRRERGKAAPFSVGHKRGRSHARDRSFS